MKTGTGVDLAACRQWRPSFELGDARIGLIPTWNAVTLLNPAAATIWDLAVETREIGPVVAGYGRVCPDRAGCARADVEACLATWAAQGFFTPPAPSPEQRALAARAGRPAPRPAQVSLRRTLALGRDTPPVTVVIADPLLGRAIEDLVTDFPDAPGDPSRTLLSTGPEGGWRLSLDGTTLRLAGNLAQARGQIVAELVRLAGGETGWLATLHGAVVTGLQGTILLAGSTGAGKSTLCAGLVAHGWKLLAEDVAAIDAAVNVAPIPFALSIKAGAVGALKGAFPGLATRPVHRLGARRVRYHGLPAESRARAPARPELILDIRFDPDMDHEASTFTPLSPPETLGLFLNEESYVDFEHADVDAFFAFVETTPAYALRYGSIEAAENAIRTRLLRRRTGAQR